ncbi:MAG: helix-hairpin-helix domain-containing protein [Pseudomonadota bacterium]
MSDFSLTIQATSASDLTEKILDLADSIVHLEPPSTGALREVLGEAQPGETIKAWDVNNLPPESLDDSDGADAEPTEDSDDEPSLASVGVTPKVAAALKEATIETVKDLEEFGPENTGALTGVGPKMVQKIHAHLAGRGNWPPLDEKPDANESEQGLIPEEVAAEAVGELTFADAQRVLQDMMAGTDEERAAASACWNAIRTAKSITRPEQLSPDGQAFFVEQVAALKTSGAEDAAPAANDDWLGI